MAELSGRDALQQACTAEGLEYSKVLELLELYNSEEPEEVVLAKMDEYPLAEREFVSNLILPMIE